MFGISLKYLKHVAPESETIFNFRLEITTATRIPDSEKKVIEWYDELSEFVFQIQFQYSWLLYCIQAAVRFKSIIHVYECCVNILIP